MAAWLGVLALALDALVPIHFAFDLAHAAAPARHHEQAASRDFVAALLTLVTGHSHRDAAGGGAPEKHRHGDHCAVCGAAATLAGLAPAAVPLVAAPADIQTAVPAAPAAASAQAGPLAAYHSRAPPLA